MKKGFTLIEMLVAVIIIAILTAVAWPQYTQAVVQSKVISLKPWFKAIKEGRKLYIIKTGNAKCMDLSSYLSAYGGEGKRFRCAGASHDGPCENRNGWCDGSLYITDKDVISNGTGHAFYTYNKHGYKLRFSLVTFYNGYTSDEKTGDFFCIPIDGDEKSRIFCQNIAISEEPVKCEYGGKECYRVEL